MAIKRRLCASLGLIALALSLPLGAARAQDATSSLTLSTNAGAVHYFPTISGAAARSTLAVDSGPLLYHAGGSIMPTATVYAIFWVPPTLQDGTATSMSSHYQTVERRVLTDYAGHALGSNDTQYYQVRTTRTFFQDRGNFGGFYVDTSAYPASDCVDSATPNDCISDAAIQAEIQKVMTLQGWTAGINKVFFLFTSSGEGSCFTDSSPCAYTNYCAYHGYFGSTSSPVIYSNQPYGDTSVCQVTGTPSPNADPAADTAATAASHELSESITDPLLNAWYTAQGNEVADLCAYNYGTNNWDGGLANQVWNGDPYELQTQFDNHTKSCVQVGP